MNWRLTGSWSTTTSSFEKHSRRHNQVEATPVFLILYKQFFFLTQNYWIKTNPWTGAMIWNIKTLCVENFDISTHYCAKVSSHGSLNFCAFKVVLSYSAPGFLDVFQIFLLDTECFFTCYWFSVQPLYPTIFRWMFLCLFVFLFACEATYGRR